MGRSDAKPIEETDYAAARQFFNNGDMTIRIGDRGCGGRYESFSGHTVPTCGELVLTAPTQEANQNAGAYIVQEGYYNLVKIFMG